MPTAACIRIIRRVCVPQSAWGSLGVYANRSRIIRRVCAPQSASGSKGVYANRSLHNSIVILSQMKSHKIKAAFEYLRHWPQYASASLGWCAPQSASALLGVVFNARKVNSIAWINITIIECAQCVLCYRHREKWKRYFNLLTIYIIARPNAGFLFFQAWMD